MAISSGDKMQAAKEKLAATSEPRQGKGAGMAQERDVAALRREAERLRKELAAAQERANTLATANNSVAKRLDAAIASVKAILARQG
jgi:Domain of unknown function (DUF4164)